MNGAPLRLLTVAGVAVLLVMVVATLLAVVTRFLAVTGFEWSYEVAGIAFVWTCFLGGIVAEAAHENAAFDVLHAAAPPVLRVALDHFGSLLLLLVGAALLASGIATVWRSGWVPTPLLRWPGFVQSTAAPMLGFCLCVLALARLLRRGARHLAASLSALAAGHRAGTPS
jgi:TRAP-type C4-dicarboxylate transport system permease small subunit